MKKFYYSLFAAAAMLLATSCSQEEEMVQADNGVAKFSVSLQGATGSRAAGDGQTVDKLYYEVYEDDTKIPGDAYDNVVDMTAGKADVNIPLMRGHEYQIVFWAQNSEAGIYDAEDLKAISVNYDNNATANNEKYDAFYNAITYTVEAGVTTVELTRPFAQLNVGTTTTDWATAKNLLQGNDPADQSTVTVEGLATTFNASSGEATGTADVTFAAADFIGEEFTLNDVTYKNLAMNYLLVPGTEEEAKTTTTVGVALMNNESIALSFEVPNVPIERNYRTNIVGNLFTQNGGFEVIVKPGFTDEPGHIYPEIALAAKLGGTVTLAENVTLTDGVVVEKDLIVNLNGKTLSYTGNDVLFRVKSGATVTINGTEDGSAIVTETENPGEGGNGYVGLVSENGTLIFKGGSYEAKSTCTIAQASNGTIKVYGGTFKVNTEEYTDVEGNASYLLNCSDTPYKNGEAVIEVYGGTFCKFNPANNAAEGLGTDFVAYGYTVTYNDADNTYTVVENPLEQAMLAGATEISLTEDVTLHESFILEAGKQLTIDLADRSIINTSNSEEFGEGEAIIAYGKLTLEGEGTVQANSMAVWARGTEGAEITINGGTYIGMADGLAKGGRSVIYASSGNTINIYGGTFEALTIDETSYAEDLYAVLNVADNNGTINVYGGSFKNFNPKLPGTEPANWNTEHPNGFVADGYKVKTSEDDEGNTIYTVVDEYFPDVVVSSADELTAALAGSEKYIGLSEGIIFEGTFNITREVVISSNKDNKATIKGRVNVDSNGSGSVFNNIKFDINEESKTKNKFTGTNYQYPAIVVIYAAATTFEGCEFKTGITTGVCGINYGSHATGKMLKVNNCSFEGDFYAIRSRTLFSVTNSRFNIYTNLGTLAAIFTWGNGASGTNNDSGANIVIFTGNENINNNKIYGVQMTSTTFNYAQLNINVQNNINFNKLSESIKQTCNFTGTMFEQGSETFDF